MEKKKRQSLMAFLGGKTSYYVVGLVVLLALAVLLLQKVSFIFHPIVVVLQTILPPVVFALLLFYLLNPLVDFLNKHGVPRTLSITLTYLVIFGLLILGGFQLVPVIEEQSRDLADNFPSLINDFQKAVENILANTPLKNWAEQAFDSVDEWWKDIAGIIGDNWQQGAKSLGNIFSAVSSVAITIFTGPIIAFFLIKDPRKLYRAVIQITPPKFRDDTKSLIKIANQQLGAFLKGQVIASLLLGLIYWGVFLLIGMEYSTVIALAAGILSIIPYVGAFLAFIPGLFIAFQISTFMVVKFVIAWFAVQLLHGDLVVPRVMGDRLKIHPVTILVVLLVMGDLLGVVGVIFGIPIYSMIKLAVVFIFRKFKQRYNRYFGDEGEYQETEFSEKDY